MRFDFSTIRISVLSPVGTTFRSSRSFSLSFSEEQSQVRKSIALVGEKSEKKEYLADSPLHRQQAPGQYPSRPDEIINEEETIGKRRKSERESEGEGEGRAR